MSLKRLVQRLLYIAMPNDSLRAAALYLRNEVTLQKPKMPVIASDEWHVFLTGSPNASKVQAALNVHVPSFKMCVGQGDCCADTPQMLKSHVVVVFGEAGAFSCPSTEAILNRAQLNGKPTVAINPGVVFADLLGQCPRTLHAYLFQVLQNAPHIACRISVLKRCASGHRRRVA